jgi:hypothetical protein
MKKFWIVLAVCLVASGNVFAQATGELRFTVEPPAHEGPFRESIVPGGGGQGRRIVPDGGMGTRVQPTGGQGTRVQTDGGQGQRLNLGDGTGMGRHLNTDGGQGRPVVEQSATTRFGFDRYNPRR